MREVGLESNHLVLDFAKDLIAGKFDLVIFMTGVGVRAMVEIVKAKGDVEPFLAALRTVKIAAREAKPSTSLRELKIPVEVTSDEPSTWHELLEAIDEEFGTLLQTMNVAVQEYGAQTQNCSQS